jgi:hypothetical protein
MRQYEIEIDNIILEIQYDFIEGSNGDYFDPPQADQVEILHISLRVQNSITDILSSYVLNRAETEIWNTN